MINKKTNSKYINNLIIIKNNQVNNNKVVNSYLTITNKEYKNRIKEHYQTR